MPCIRVAQRTLASRRDHANRRTGAAGRSEDGATRMGKQHGNAAMAGKPATDPEQAAWELLETAGTQQAEER
ncbi:hypothetical protein GCM10011504_48520 [Siccirubricoccus deserti]|nr:hypothetical protein GCM10011504_48520 [Siccirubricoccus deserti]